jgi:hypothetical protein
MKLKFNGFLVLLVCLVAQLTLRRKELFELLLTRRNALPGVSVLVKGTKTGTQTILTENIPSS